MLTTTTEIDVLIIGGGPSGSCAGAALAKAGKRVRILESSDFSKPRVGESLLPCCNALLRKIGVWEKVESAGFVRKFGAEFETADGALRVHNIFARGLVPGLDYTYQVQRPRFDQILLDHAAESGCELDRTSAIRAIETHADHYCIHMRDGRSWTSRWLIDASGRQQFLGRHWKLPTEPDPYLSRVAVFNHFSDVQRATGAEGGNIIVTRQTTGWFWQIPIRPETTSLGYVSLSSDLRDSNLNPQDWFERNVEATPAVARRLRHAQAEGGFRTTTDYSHMFQAFCGTRFFLTGDAATFSDPIFSSGIYLGLESALSAALAIVKADTANQALSARAQKDYTADLKRRSAIIRELIDIFYSPSGFAVFMHPTDKLQLFAAVNSIVAGNTRPDFSVRWRYILFKLICRWNKNYRLAPNVL